MTYTKDTARACGAQCNRCAFSRIRAAGFAPPEINPRAGVLVVGDFPDKHAVEKQRPFVGSAGQELQKGLIALNIKRDQIAVTNAVLCQPVSNKMDKVRSQLKIINEERAEQNKEPLLMPVDACRPRLLNEVAEYQNIITLGGLAYQGVTDSRIAVMNMRGAPVDATINGEAKKILPTLHPSFVLRQLRWRHVFKKDLSRAFRWFRGEYGWKDPYVIYKPTYQQIDSFLQRKESFFVMDYETTIEVSPLDARVKCIGIGNTGGTFCLIIPFLSIDGHTRFYTEFDEQRIVARIIQFFEDESIKKVGQNHGNYDQLVAIGQWKTRMRNILDTILLHRSVESEMPHNLAYIGSVYTDIPSAWKSEHTATTAQTDEELWRYCAIDLAVTARAVPPLVKLVHERNQVNVVKNDHKIQEVCVGMHINGMLVDLKARDEWDKKLLTDAVRYRKQCREAVEDDKFNPASVNQIRDLLFDKWDLPIISHTDKHDTSSPPSTDDDTIRALLLEPGLEPKQKRFLSALRMFRRRAKLRGTYIVKLRRKGEIYTLDDLAIDEDLEDDANEFSEKDKKKEGILGADGRVRTSWNAHGTNTGRLSSSRPYNLQNVPIKMRNIFIPGEGRVFVYADMDQLELRLATMFSGAKVYSQVFAEGGDPHSVSTLMVMGDEGKILYDAAVAKYGSAKQARKKDEAWSRVCDFGKRFTYAAIYKATVETIHEVLRSAEDDQERLIYADLTIEKTQMSHRNWLAQNPEFEQWWQAEIESYRSLGYSVDAMHGRRCDFADGENENQIVNYRCQSSGAAIVNEGTLAFVDRVKFGKYGRGTGLVNQTHDALMAEIPVSLAEKAKVFLEDCLHRKVPGFDMDFTASAKIMKNWGGS